MEQTPPMLLMQEPVRKPNEGQRVAIDGIVRAITEDRRKEVLLRGAAGTGKTWVVREVLRQLPRYSSALLAFSNKAKRVLSEACPGYEADTLHGMFGIKVNKDNDGKRVERDPGKSENFHQYNLLVIDECSMIEDEMVDYIRSRVSGQQIIWIGDVCQLPPVHQKEPSKTFEVSPEFVLSEQMRFGDDNLLSCNANTIRGMIERAIDAGVTLPLIRYMELRHDYPVPPEGENLIRVDNERQLLEAALEVMDTQEYRDDPSLAKIIALNVKLVTQMNLNVRTRIYGANAARYVAGESLMVNKAMSVWMAVGDRIKLVADAAETVRVQRTVEAPVLRTVEAYDMSIKINVWELEIQTEMGMIYTVWVPANEDAKEDHQALCLELRKIRDREYRVFKASNLPKDRERYVQAKKQYEKVRDCTFADLDYNYALTVHKAQGSTFRFAFLALSNIKEERNIKGFKSSLTIWKAAYVGMTRAKEVLVYCD